MNKKRKYVKPKPRAWINREGVKFKSRLIAQQQQQHQVQPRTIIEILQRYNRMTMLQLSRVSTRRLISFDRPRIASIINVTLYLRCSLCVGYFYFFRVHVLVIIMRAQPGVISLPLRSVPHLEFHTDEFNDIDRCIDGLRKCCRSLLSNLRRGGMSIYSPRKSLREKFFTQRL